MKILHTADSHIGADLPARRRHDRPRRGDDFINSFYRVLQLALRQRVDLVIHAGDLFDLPDPHDGALTAASAALHEVAVAGIPVVLVPGNHERNTIPDSLYLTHPNLCIVREPETFRFWIAGATLAVAALPCLGRAAASRFSDALELTGWRQQAADFRILAVHDVFESACCGPANYRFRRGDRVISRSAVPSAFDYVAAGHVHRHQTLHTPDPRGPAIVYAGSPDRVTFAEIDEPKGCVLVEESAGRLVHRFIQHAVRPMRIHPLDITGLSADGIREQIYDAVRSLPPQAVAQFRLTGRCPPHSLRSLNLSEWAWSARPDVLITLSVSAVEYDEHTTVRADSSSSVFDLLDAPAGRIARKPRTRFKELPRCLGVYALYDDGGRILYVGKSNDVRIRVQTHHRGTTPGNYFAGWMKQIKTVEVRRAYSELEAALVEFELIRRARPPFNRQMRMWRQYCYIQRQKTGSAKLEVIDTPTDGAPYYGPFRSRPAAIRICETLSALGDTAAEADFAGHCDALLAGRERSWIAAAGDGGPPVTVQEQGGTPAQLLESTFEYCAALTRAENFYGGLIILPGPDRRMRTIVHINDGFCFRRLSRSTRQLGNALQQDPQLFRTPPPSAGRRISTIALDGYLLLLRHLEQDPADVIFLPEKSLQQLTPHDLLELAFDS